MVPLCLCEEHQLFQTGATAEVCWVICTGVSMAPPNEAQSRSKDEVTDI